MRTESTREFLENSGALVTGGHFVYVSGLHGSTYLNKDVLYRRPDIARQVGEILAAWAPADIDVVVGPAMGGVILAQWVAFHLSQLGKEVLAVYAEKDDEVIVAPEERGPVYMVGTTYNRKPGDVILVRHDRFVIKRGNADRVAGKNVLVVEDSVMTGNSLRATVSAAREAGGNVVGAVCIVSRDGLMKEDLGVEYFASQITLFFDSHTEEDCPNCRVGAAVSTSLGHGTSFLARKHRMARAAEPF